MTPVRDAVRLIHDQQADPWSEKRHDFSLELFVPQALGRHEQAVAPVVGQTPA